MYRADRARRGFTLVELLLFIVIVGIAVAGVVQVLALTTRQSADPLRRKQALMIAEALLEEVELARFSYCDPSDPKADTAASAADCTIREEFGQSAPEPVGPRPYDNVNDYVSAANTAVQAFNAGGALAYASGAPMNLAGYTATVSMTPETLNDIVSSGTSANAEVLRIRIEVTYDTNKTVALDGYRTRYAPRVE